MRMNFRLVAVGLATLVLIGALYFIKGCGKPSSPRVPDDKAPKTIMEMVTANDRPLEKLIDDYRVVERWRVDDPEHVIQPQEALSAVENVFNTYACGQMIRTEDILRYAEALDPGVRPASCEGKMMNLDGKGSIAAVIRTHEGGSGGGYQIRIFLKEPRGFFCYLFEGDTEGILFEEEPSLDQQVVDLDGDGQAEVIVTRSPWEHGAMSVANWPLVYRLKAGRFVYAENRFADFYRTKVLPKYLDALVPEARMAIAPEDRQWNLLHNRDCQQIIDRINRLGSNSPAPE